MDFSTREASTAFGETRGDGPKQTSASSGNGPEDSFRRSGKWRIDYR